MDRRAHHPHIARRRRLIAWAGLLALVAQLAAPLVHGLAASALADDELAGISSPVICHTVAAAGQAGTPDSQDRRSDRSLPCAFCLVCQAAFHGAKFTLVSVDLVPPTAGRFILPDMSRPALRPRGAIALPPPSRAPPPFLA